MSRLLLYLPALACPVLMLVCMAAMRRMGGSTGHQEPSATDTATRIAALERELADLRAQHAAAEAAADDVAGEPGRPPANADRVS
jgi:hypothetical protein